MGRTTSARLFAFGVACVSVLVASGCGSASNSTATTSATATGAATATAAATATDTTTLPLAPLSSLGPLKPAPAGVPGPEGVPVPKTKYVLARPQRVRLGQTIAGIKCERNEHFAYHIHVHLTVFVRGSAYAVPLAVGIGDPRGVQTAGGPFVTTGSCFMWLHTHAFDGVIHIESPTRTTYTLGQFFRVWGAVLTRGQVGPARGTVTAFYNGKVWTGNPGDMPLLSENQIQVDVGQPIVAPSHIVFPSDLAGSCTNAAGKVAPC